MKCKRTAVLKKVFGKTTEKYDHVEITSKYDQSTEAFAEQLGVST